MWQEGVVYRATREGWGICPMSSPTTFLQIHEGHSSNVLVCNIKKPKTLYLVEDLQILEGCRKRTPHNIGNTTIVFYEIVAVGRKRSENARISKRRRDIETVLASMSDVAKWPPEELNKYVMKILGYELLPPPSAYTYQHPLRPPTNDPFDFTGKSDKCNERTQMLQEILLDISPHFEFPEVNNKQKVIMACQAHKGLRRLPMWRLSMLFRSTGYII